MLLQPHFLFNSLNNLYALSVKQSDKTTDAIAGLSELLEKVVDYSRMDRIPLEKEVGLIQEFINLEKIWLGETRFCLDFHISGNLESIDIPPLVLYTFVENCFKHGVRKCQDNGWVTIHIEEKQGKLYFITRNSVPPACEESGSVTEGNHAGLGMEAAVEILRSRCQGHHVLKTRMKGHVFAVDLMIDTTA